MEPFRSHFAKIVHKVAKSKYFPNIYNEPFSPLNFLSNDRKSVVVSFVVQKLSGEEVAPRATSAFYSVKLCI